MSMSDILEQTIRNLPSHEEAIRRQNVAYANLRFMTENRDTLRQEYPNKFIAVHNARLVAAADTSEELIEAIERNGLPMTDVLLDFVIEEPVAFVL